MAGFVEEVRPISECVDYVAKSLSFPWDVPGRSISIRDALHARSSHDMFAGEPNPPFTRSLRDGYAVNCASTTGASAGAPVFLRLAGEVHMGEEPTYSLAPDEVASVPTGGGIPTGADAVVMIEDTAAAGGWVEIRRAVQRGENLIVKGEEIAQGDRILERGALIHSGDLGMLSTLGITSLDAIDLRIGILSTGDEILPIETHPLPPGFVRDANSYVLQSVLRRYGFASRTFGIVGDDADELARRVRLAMAESDVVLLSGGSSVGVRDHATQIMESLPAPGLLVRGINMIPGKPTLIAGALEEKKLLLGLPGHPLSCMTSAIFVLLPLLLALCGASEREVGRYLRLRLGSDVQGHTGPDEFIPMRIEGGMAYPMAAKSGYVSAMRGSDGFLRLYPNIETLRRGEEATVWTW